MEDHLMCRRKRLKHCHKKPIFRQWSSKIQFLDLPEDVLGTILSKLPPKEIVRTSVISNKWKHIWKVCPKLRFDGITMCAEDVTGTQHCTQKFIDNVNGVLKQYSGKVVEELDVKFEFDATLAEHLDDWVNFALSSRAKNLALDLLPAKFRLRPDRYRIPLEFFDGESIFRLQHLQLSFVSFESPSNFCGFPNLKKLDLHVLRVTREDLQDMLSNCFNLEWLSIVRCHLYNAELKVVRLLPRLLYLHVAYCDISGIGFSAVNLQTFVYRGRWIPFHLGHALALKDARLYFIGKMTLEFALNVLPNLLPSVQNLILHSSLPLETPCLQGNCSKFRQLKYLQLKFFVLVEDLSNLLGLASILRAAPFIEKLEIHFSICAFPHCPELIRSLPRNTHNYLKNLSITGFAGCMGQVELLTHIVENAPNLEALTIDRVNHFGVDEEYERQSRSKALDIVRRHLEGRTSENTKVSIM
ncbi:hypothetical protein C2845_PM07G34560 [Panicum miliaceum]|uniref:F-box domain-containing protein n=1 Tax=Panicum miliaceum TaxID=4540 RepID=A0A3L6SHU1_PANMI|nr:hypothetical protein C2845_PM07G34560 [Panicum miliaceum]